LTKKIGLGLIFGDFFASSSGRFWLQASPFENNPNLSVGLGYRRTSSLKISRMCSDTMISLADTLLLQKLKSIVSWASLEGWPGVDFTKPLRPKFTKG
jgi:hypothetical protein